MAQAYNFAFRRLAPGKSKPVQCRAGCLFNAPLGLKMNEKRIQALATLATFATLMSIGMYVAYIVQIKDNLGGHKGNPVQPFVAFVNCTLWTCYGLFKEKRDWPIVIANVPGIFLGLATSLTAL